MGLRLARCNDRACAGTNEAISALDPDVAEAGWFDGHASIAVGADGNPIVSYHDPVGRTLEVARSPIGG